MEIEKPSIEKRVDKNNNEVKKKKANGSQTPHTPDLNRYAFRLWNIRANDLDPEDKYLNQKSYSFKLDAKFFRFSGFSCFSESTLMFSKKKGLEIKSHGKN